MLVTKLKRLVGHSASRYLVIGLLAFGLDYAVLMVSYYVVGLPLAAATFVGFMAGFLISFTGNKLWVFGGDEQSKRTRRQAAEYIALLAGNCLFTIWSVGFLNAHGFPPFIGKMAPIALVTCWDYMLFRWAIFGKKSEAEPQLSSPNGRPTLS